MSNDGIRDLAVRSLMETTWPSGQATFVVTDDIVRRYTAACGGQWQPGGIVPSGLASVYCYAAVAAMPVKSGVVLTGQAYEFHTELRVGDTLSTEFAVSKLFERKGRDYMVIATSTTNDSGDLVCTGEITRLLPPPTEVRT